MKEVIITINENEITERIAAESGYTSMARNKAGLPERFTDIMQATDDDGKLISTFVSDSINEASGLINRFLSPCSVKFDDTGEGESRIILIRFTLPHNSPESTAEALKNCITGFAVDRSLQMWAQTVSPDEAGRYAAKADTEAAKMRSFMTVRERPQLRSNSSNKIIEL